VRCKTEMVGGRIKRLGISADFEKSNASMVLAPQPSVYYNEYGAYNNRAVSNLYDENAAEQLEL